MHCKKQNTLLAPPATALAASMALVPVGKVFAANPDYVTAEEPAAESVHETKSPISKTFTETPVSPSHFPDLKGRLENLSPLWRDSTLTTQVRSFFFDRTNNGAQDNVAWALGGWVDYSSGWWRERVKARAVLYTSQRLYGPNNNGGTLLLEPVQRSFTVLGQAQLEARVTDETQLRLFRQTFDLPYVNRQDNRMVPNTFEAYTIVNRAIPHLTIGGSHLRQMKVRNSSKFVSMSEAAGFEGTGKDLTMGGVRFSPSESLHVGAINQHSWDFMNTFYAEGDLARKLTGGLGMRVSAQYTDQRSIGSELGGDFNTHVLGGKVAASYGGAILTLAFSSTADDSGIRTPYGGYPGYLSLIVKDFDRAGEDAWLVGFSYSFKGLGVPGLSAFANYAQGDTPDSGSEASPDQQELDITVDFRPEHFPLKGLWLRARRAWVDQDGSDGIDVDDFRVIVNYEVPVL